MCAAVGSLVCTVLPDRSNDARFSRENGACRALVEMPAKSATEVHKIGLVRERRGGGRDQRARTPCLDPV